VFIKLQIVLFILFMKLSSTLTNGEIIVSR